MYAMNSLLPFGFFILTYMICENGVLSSNDSLICSKDDVCSTYGMRLVDDSSNKCCLPCLCTDNCDLGKCCPDASKLVESGAKCKHQLEFIRHFQTEEYLKILDENARTSFYVVSECPPNSPYDLRMDCEHTTHPEDNKYVHDAATYTIYKNERCAQCNGVTSYVKWRLVISANETEVDDILKDRIIQHEDLDKNRIVLSVPPVDYPENINICDPEAISSCNVTGRWDIYDANMFKLCSLSQLAPVFVPPTSYRNVYCALCNHDSSRAFPRCSQSSPSRGISHDTLKLLIWTPKEEIAISADVKDKSNQCPIISRFESACREVLCPIGQYYIGSECVNGNFELYERNVEVGIRIEFDSETFLDDEYAFIKANVLSQLKFEENNCLMFFFGVYRLTDNAYKYKMYVHVKTTKTCRIDTVLEVMKQFEMLFSTPYKIQQSPSKMVYIKALIDASEALSNLVGINWLSGNNTVSQAKIDVQLKPKCYCPSIKYSAKDISNLLGNHVANAMMLASEVFMSDANQAVGLNHTRIICVSEYRRILMEHGLLNSASIVAPIYITIFLISCFVALL